MSGVLACIIWAIANLDGLVHWSPARVAVLVDLECGGRRTRYPYAPIRSHRPGRLQSLALSGWAGRAGLGWPCTSGTGLGWDGWTQPTQKKADGAHGAAAPLLRVWAFLPFFLLHVFWSFWSLHFPCPCSSPTPPKTNCDGLRTTSTSPHPHVHTPPLPSPKDSFPFHSLFSTRWTIPCFS